ncbi:mesothelin-like protein [Clupea harengus]|uniref:Mesothelin-like protein n=1 Tax=Clupea harengus TaxID=7950 RepID=A0A8M1KJU6_CLUHA|nr:mesothelin-like protein [Clupea harengus]
MPENVFEYSSNCELIQQGIRDTTISRPNVEVLGNMACILDRPYIQNSDPEIIEKMKNCNDFSDAQSSAMQTVLIQGNTKYGPPSRWRRKTLNDLGILPLYFSHDFWRRFNRRTQRNFLKKFLRSLRRRKTQKRKMKRLFRQLMRGLRTKRGANECTVGNITRVTISDDAFPFGYDATQFGHCLSAQVVKENLASLTEKVDVDEFQRVILDRLDEAYPSGLPDEQVQLLGSVSRVATTTDLSKWNISSPDTLAALMNSDDGEWEPDMSKLIVTKFLSGSNSLNSSELNFLGGPNLCALDTSTLTDISSDSIKGADSLDLSNCTTEKKKVLFETARQAFPVNFQNRDSDDTLTSYQLLEPYLGGASIDVIRGFSACNVSMDIETFIGLDEPVVLDLTVSEVSGLLGSNLPDLASYENETVVQNWISRQFQSQLDTLDLGLTGGRAEAATTASSNSTGNATTAATPTTVTTATTTVTTATTATTTASAGNKGSSYSLPFIFLMLNMAFIKIQIV